jgi:hypothetical protein
VLGKTGVPLTLTHARVATRSSVVDDGHPILNAAQLSSDLAPGRRWATRAARADTSSAARLAQPFGKKWQA